MKKLMTVLASAATALCAVGAWADFTETSTDFESSTAGQAFDSNNGMDSHWVGASDAELFISNHTDTISVSRPDYLDRANTNANYLAIENSVTRGLNTVEGGEFAGVAIPDNGIYLDTLVKFTAADTPFEANLTDGDKIAIEYVDQTTDDTIPEEEQIKGFVIRAGQTVGEVFGQANYLADAPDGFNVNEWHRLTVRSIADVGDGQVGFVIYLDGDVNHPLAYDTSVDAGFGTLDQAVAEKFYNNSLHALYPSAVDSQGTGGSEISAVSFSGTGCIDDVVFTTTTPNFIQQGESVVVSFVADAGVTAISVSVDGEDDPFPVVNGAATLPAQTADFTVNVTVDEANGYTLGSISYKGTPLVNGEVTGYDGGDITITTTRNNFNLFDADGHAITTGAPFQTLSAALTANNVARIVLAHDYNVAENEGAEFGAYDIVSDITLDLNGNTITGGGNDELFSVDSGVTMIVIDSSAANTGKIDYTGTYAVFYSEGNVVIGAPTGDYGPTIDGYLAAAADDGDGIWLVKAKIEAETNSAEGEFLWDGYLGDPDGTITSGADLDSDEEYWVVTPQNTPQPTTYEVTWTLTGGSASATSGDDFEEDDTIVFTADSGKTLSYLSIDGVEDSSEYGASSYTYTVGTADAVLVVTFTEPAPTTYEVTWTLSGGTASATSGDDFEENDTIVFTADSGKTLSFVSIDGTEISDTSVYGANSYTYTVGTADAVLVVTFTEESSYPSYIEEITDSEKKAAYEKKYDTWATTYSVADGAGNEEAFLLNCAPADVETAKANFKIPSITVDAEGNVTVGTIEGTFNGKLQLKGSTDLSTWTNLDAASKDYNFFKYELTY